MTTSSQSEQMRSLSQAAEEFRRCLASVYRGDQSRIERDVNAAAETIGDHVGRWPLELLQNADDARASEVRIRLTDQAVYFADNGVGLTPEAVKSLSGTHSSPKKEGTIGRKGLGFKAVYGVSERPRVWSGAEGILFCRERARQWMLEHSLPVDLGVPDVWIPFAISRAEAEQDDSVLAEFRAYQTVVVLPLRPGKDVSAKALEKLLGLPAHLLLTFRHIQSVEVVADTDSFAFRAERIGEDRWRISDERDNSTTAWRCRRETHPVPPAINERMSADLRRRLCEVDVLVASPVKETDLPCPLDDHGELLVYYPTDHPSPVPLVLHADFLVSSDRRTIIDPTSTPFNEWLCDRLARTAVEYVCAAYSVDAPEAFLRLLEPYPNLDEHSLTEYVWKRICIHARQSLRLPDQTGRPRVELKEARVLNLSVGIDDARAIVAPFDGSRLVHPDLERARDVHPVLEALGCTITSSSGFIDWMEKHLAASPSYHDWLLTCCCWLSDWVAEPGENRSGETRRRSDRVRRLALLPINGRLWSSQELGDQKATWRNEQVELLPDWLRLHLVDNWFRDQLAEVERPNVKQLREALGLVDPNAHVLLNAICRAIDRFWKDSEDEPERFLPFIVEQQLHEAVEASDTVGDCPIPVRRSGASTYAPARHTYFGSEFNNDLLARVYGDDRHIPWAIPLQNREDLGRPILEWLGVSWYPRVVEETRDEMKASEYARVSPLVNNQKILSAPCCRLERLEPSSLTPAQSAALIAILSRHWGSYYEKRRHIPVLHTPRSLVHTTEVDSRWWHDVQYNLRPPTISNPMLDDEVIRLKSTVLPNHEIDREAPYLLPAVDPEPFGRDWPQVADWLGRQACVRSDLHQIDVREWRDLLTHRARLLVPRLGVGEGKKIATKWYSSALRALKQRDEEARERLGKLPLVCACGEKVAVVDSRESRWLGDDPEILKDFGERVWHLDLPERDRPAAKQQFRLPSLREDVEVQPEWSADQVRESPDGQSELERLKPYLFAWRADKKGSSSQFREQMVRLRVKFVDDLWVRLRLKGTDHECVVNRKYYVAGNDVIVQTGYGSTAVASGVAQWLGVRGERYFIETLFRCKDNDQREQEIVSRGVLPEHIAAALETWRGQDDVPPTASHQSATPPNGAAEPTAQLGHADESHGLQGAPADGGVSLRPDSATAIERSSSGVSSQTTRHGGNGSSAGGSVATEGMASNRHEREEEPREWRLSCEPEKAGVGERREPSLRSSTVISPKEGETSAKVAGETPDSRSDRDVEESEAVQDDADPNLRRKVGRWGEEWVARVLLQQELVESHPGTVVSEEPHGFTLRRDGKDVVRVLWVNHVSEQRKPYDITIDQGGHRHYIEVKASMNRETEWFQITGPEWSCATEQGNRYLIYRVRGAGEYRPDYQVIQNPVELWRNGSLEGAPLRLRL